MSAPLPFTEVAGDDAILNFIFDPRRAFIGAAAPEPGVTGGPRAPVTAAEAVHAECTVAERTAVLAAEAGDVTTARRLLDDLVRRHPDRASAWNNRAQLRRMGGDVAGAAADVDEAIRCGHTWLEAHAGGGAPPALTEHTRKTLQAAHTQRAVMRKEGGDAEGELRDMESAAAFGSTLARVITTGVSLRARGAIAAWGVEVVDVDVHVDVHTGTKALHVALHPSQTNPYATLCSVAVSAMLEGAAGAAGAVGAGTAAAGAGTAVAPGASGSESAASAPAEPGGRGK